MKFQIISSGQYGEEFCDYINEKYAPDYTCEFKPEINQSDLANANALAGFYSFSKLDLRSIKWIHAFAAGVDSYLKHPNGLPEDLMLTRTLGFMDKRIGEFCLSHCLADLKEIGRVYQAQQDKHWERFNLDVLYDKKVLIFGTGFVGKGIASAFSGLAERVTGVNTSGKNFSPFDSMLSMSASDSFQEFDIVINTLPLTVNTMNLFDINLFSKFRNAHFMNVGRGQSVVESDIFPALDEGFLRKATLDVFQEEPPVKESKLWIDPRVIITPHHAGLTTFEDVKKSFSEVINCIESDTQNDLFVDLGKGY